MLRITPASYSQSKVGGSTFQVMSFSNIQVQGDYDKIINFVSDLDSGKTLPTMVLKKVAVNKVEFIFTGAEGERRAEFRAVAAAVKAMMTDNNLSEIPSSMKVSRSVATNLTGDNPDTIGVLEGFPDITTKIEDKGYTGNVTPKDGYLLYGHDKITTGNTTQYTTVNYFATPTTIYFYTCEPDGTVRQWNSPNLATAGEYTSSEKSKMDTKISVDVDIYFKPK